MAVLPWCYSSQEFLAPCQESAPERIGAGDQRPDRRQLSAGAAWPTSGGWLPTRFRFSTASGSPCPARARATRLACYNQEEIGKAVGIAQQTVADFLQILRETVSARKAVKSAISHEDGFEPQVYSVWNFAKATNPAPRARGRQLLPAKLR